MSGAFFAKTDFTALGTFTADASLLAGFNQQPVIPPNVFANDDGKGRAFRITASGVVSCTGTPTYTFTQRIHTSAASLGGTALGVSAAITMQSGVTNKLWWMEVVVIVVTPGIGSGSATLHAAGTIWSAGFASPFRYPLEPATPDTATWTCTSQGEAQTYLNLSVACSASDAANAIRCKQYVAEALN